MRVGVGMRPPIFSSQGVSCVLREIRLTASELPAVNVSALHRKAACCFLLSPHSAGLGLGARVLLLFIDVNNLERESW